MITKHQLLGSILSVSALLIAGHPARADVKLPGLFTDNAVLQQGMDVPVWGWADDGEEVTVNFAGQQAKATTANGKWMVKLSPLKASGEPQTLKVTGKNTVEVKDVVVGEVWVCSGQSNMEFPLQRSFEAPADIDGSANDMIRLFHVPKLKSDKPVKDAPTTWKKCDPKSVTGFSAVGYYFGRALQKARGVPVGLIESDWGGSPAEVWMKHSVLEENPRYASEIVEQNLPGFQKYQEAEAAYQKTSAEAKAAGKPAPRKPTAPVRPSLNQNRPTGSHRPPPGCSDSADRRPQI